jgi:hypothetical protein
MVEMVCVLDLQRRDLEFQSEEIEDDTYLLGVH